MEVEFATSQYRSAIEEDVEVKFEQDIPSVPWSQLPPHIIEKIYSFLGRKDQCSMSGVCKNWSEEFSSPSLWRNMIVRFPEHKCTNDLLPEVRFAQKYGHFFRHVWVIYRRRHHDIKQLILLLQCLENRSQLRSISLKCLDNFCSLSAWDIFVLQQSVINLLQKQNRLQSVEFKDTLFNGNYASEILEAIFFKNSKNMKDLTLENFIYDYWIDKNVYQSLTFAMMSLERLSIDYTTYFEKTVTSLYEYGSGLGLQKTGALKSVILICKGYDIATFKGVQPEAWKYFRKIFPTCKLDLRIETEHLTENKFDVFIVRHMPARSLDLRWDGQNYLELGPIIRDLMDCEINEKLEFLSISGLGNADLDEDLLKIVQVFPKLRELQLCFESQVIRLDTIFEYWLGSGPTSLETVHVIIKMLAPSLKYRTT